MPPAGAFACADADGSRAVLLAAHVSRQAEVDEPALPPAGSSNDIGRLDVGVGGCRPVRGRARRPRRQDLGHRAVVVRRSLICHRLLGARGRQPPDVLFRMSHMSAGIRGRGPPSPFWEGARCRRHALRGFRGQLGQGRRLRTTPCRFRPRAVRTTRLSGRSIPMAKYCHGPWPARRVESADVSERARRVVAQASGAWPQADSVGRPSRDRRLMKLLRLYTTPSPAADQPRVRKSGSSGAAAPPGRPSLREHVLRRRQLAEVGGQCGGRRHTRDNGRAVRRRLNAPGTGDNLFALVEQRKRSSHVSSLPARNKGFPQVLEAQPCSAA